MADAEMLGIRMISSAGSPGCFNGAVGVVGPFFSGKFQETTQVSGSGTFLVLGDGIQKFIGEDPLSDSCPLTAMGQVTSDLGNEFSVSFNMSGNVEVIYSYESMPVEVKDVVIAQVVFNPDKEEDGVIDLVVGDKAAAIVALAESPNIDPAEDVTVQLVKNGQVIGQLLPRALELFLKPINERSAAELTATSIAFMPEGNGPGTLSIRVKKTDGTLSESRPINVMKHDLDAVNMRLVRLNPCTDHPEGACSYGRIEESRVQGALSQRLFAEKVMPLAQGRLRFRDEGASLVGSPNKTRPGDSQISLGQAVDIAHLLRFKKILNARSIVGGGEGVQRLVALAADDYFTFHGDASSPAGYVKTQGGEGVVVLNQRYTSSEAGDSTLAHELAHSFGVNEEYEINNNPPRVGGYDPIDDIFFDADSKVTIMAKWAPSSIFWIARNTYNTIFKTLIEKPIDPKLVVVTGVLRRDNTIVALDTRILEKGDLTPNENGPLRFNIRNASGTLLSSTAVRTSFQIIKSAGDNQTTDQFGLKNIDFEPFSIALPFIEEGAIIQVVNAGQVIRAVPMPEENKPPTLNSLELLEGGFQNESVSISYEKLFAASDVQDADGDEISFRVESINHGEMLINGNPVISGETLVKAGDILIWSPDVVSLGIVDAFSVSAFDGELSSENVLSVTINVKPIPEPETPSVEDLISFVKNINSSEFRRPGVLLKALILIELTLAKDKFERKKIAAAEALLKVARQSGAKFIVGPSKDLFLEKIDLLIVSLAGRRK